MPASPRVVGADLVSGALEHVQVSFMKPPEGHSVERIVWAGNPIATQTPSRTSSP